MRDCAKVKENTRVDAANMSKRFGSESATNNAMSHCLVGIVSRHPSVIKMRS